MASVAATALSVPLLSSAIKNPNSLLYQFVIIFAESLMPHGGVSGIGTKLLLDSVFPGRLVSMTTSFDRQG